MILISTSEFASNNKNTVCKTKNTTSYNRMKWIKIFRNLKDDFQIGERWI